MTFRRPRTHRPLSMLKYDPVGTFAFYLLEIKKGELFTSDLSAPGTQGLLNGGEELVLAKGRRGEKGRRFI